MSETKQLYTPIDELVALCNKHNHTPLDINQLTCNKCKKWLTKPIYIMRDGHNVCEECKPNACIQNVSLESVLEGKQYPCKFNKAGCNYFSNSIHNHEKECPIIKRSICKMEFHGQSDLIEHLKMDHSMKTLQLTKPVAKWEVDIVEKTTNNFTLLEAGQTKLIVCILPTETITKYRMCIYNGSKNKRVLLYTIEIMCGEVNRKIQSALTNTFLNLDYMTTMHLSRDHNSSMKIKIYFNNYESFEPLETAFKSILKNYECPICLETFIDYCYQCTNGHNVCPNCQPKITACPICHLNIEMFMFNVKNFTNQIQRMCKFSTNGCFDYYTLAEINEHEKACPMKLICCDSCKIQNSDKAEFYNHMLKEHDMQILKNSPMVVVPGYLGWAECVFKFGFNITNYDTFLRKVSWFVQLIDGPKTNQFCNYKLEMVICGRSIVIDGNVQNNDKMEHIFYPHIAEDNLPTFLLSIAFTELKRNYKLLQMPRLLPTRLLQHTRIY